MSVLQKYLPAKIGLSEDKVEIYLIDLGLFDEEVLLPVLSEEEQARAAQFKVKDKRQQFVITRAILRNLISRCLQNTKPETLFFNYAEHGKPEINHTHMGKQIEFNVSHSGHYALIGITVINKLGVDIETISKSVDYLSLAKRYFNGTENEQLKKLPPEERVDAFYRCWSRKESFIKGDGRGVSFGLNKFGVSLDEKIQAAKVTFDSITGMKEDWFHYQPVTVPEYQTAVAANNDKLHLSSHVITN